MIKLDSPISVSLKRQPQLVELYQQLGIQTHWDLINHLPRHYEDLERLVKIADARPGKIVIKARVERIYKTAFLKRGLNLSSINVADETGSLRIVWFNQPYRAKSLKMDQWYYFAGDYSFSNRRLQMVNPSSSLFDPSKGARFNQAGLSLNERSETNWYSAAHQKGRASFCQDWGDSAKLAARNGRAFTT